MWVATRPGHDADASREPARSYARDLATLTPTSSTSSGTATTRTTTTESVARPTSSRETDYALGPPPALDHQTVSLIPTPRLYTKVRTSL